MPLYIADYLADTMHLSAAQHGAYLLLIMHYWRTSALPQGDEMLARIARMTPDEWLAAKPVIADLFQDGWRHKRIDQELEEAERLSEAGRRGGNASASRRKPVTDERSANDPPTISQRKRQRSVNDLATEEATISQRSGNDPPTIPQPLQSQSPRDRIGEARARGQSDFTEGSKALATALWQALGFNNPIEIPPEFAGVDYRAVEWERAGWTPDLIAAEARKLARDSPLKPLSYFEKVFATSFAKRQAPLPIVEVREAEKLTVTANGKSQDGNIIQAADRLRDTISSFDNGAAGPNRIRGGTGAADVRLLPQGRRE